MNPWLRDVDRDAALDSGEVVVFIGIEDVIQARARFFRRMPDHPARSFGLTDFLNFAVVYEKTADPRRFFYRDVLEAAEAERLEARNAELDSLKLLPPSKNFSALAFVVPGPKPNPSAQLVDGPNHD